MLVENGPVLYTDLCGNLLGFLCPVHTPDGTPCGLLNHMTAMCQVSTLIIILTLANGPLGYAGVVIMCMSRSI